MAEGLDDGSEWADLVIRLPPELRGYGPDIKRFVDAMLFKLRRNAAAKGKWENVPLDQALQGLDGEVGELKLAIKNGNTLEIWTEASDTANMALIVAAIALEQRGV